VSEVGSSFRRFFPCVLWSERDIVIFSWLSSVRTICTFILSQWLIWQYQFVSRFLTKSGRVRLGLRQVRRLCLVVDMSVQSRHVQILSVGLVGSQKKYVGPCSGIWKRHDMTRPTMSFLYLVSIYLFISHVLASLRHCNVIIEHFDKERITMSSYCEMLINYVQNEPNIWDTCLNATEEEKQNSS